MQSYSQWGQDRLLIDTILFEARDGVFIDIGAFDGVTFSNTCLLERDYGWTGICIEPHPTAFQSLTENRECICLHAAAAATSGEKVRFQAVDGPHIMFSGMVDTTEDAHASRVTSLQKRDGGAIEIIEVDAVRPADVLRARGMTNVDFASIDVEGAEFEVLKGLLDDDIAIKVIAIENNYGDGAVRQFLASKGFVRIDHAGEDDFYLSSSLCGPRQRLRAALTAPRRWRKDRSRRRKAQRLLKAKSD